MVARSHLLDGFAVDADPEDCVAISALEPRTIVVVHTRYSEYRMQVVDPARCRLLVEGGAHLAEATPVTLQGATAGGYLVKVGWIAKGLRMELTTPDRRLITSRVESIAVHSQALTS